MAARAEDDAGAERGDSLSVRSKSPSTPMDEDEDKGPGTPLPRASHPMHNPAPLPGNEEERLEVLKSLSLLDTEEEGAFDRITQAASATLKVRCYGVRVPKAACALECSGTLLCKLAGRPPRLEQSDLHTLAQPVLLRTATACHRLQCHRVRFCGDEGGGGHASELRGRAIVGPLCVCVCVM
jgi:hypothetical protein